MNATESNFYFSESNTASYEYHALDARDSTPLYFYCSNVTWYVRKENDARTIVYSTDSLLDLAAYLNANEIKPTLIAPGTQPERQQLDMFASTGRVDDLPLFSGTPQRVDASHFDPPTVSKSKQTKLF